MIPRFSHGVAGRLTSPILRSKHVSYSTFRTPLTHQRPLPIQQPYRKPKSSWAPAFAGMAILFAGGLAGFSALYQQKAPYSDRKRFVFYSNAEAAETEGSTTADLHQTRAALEAIELHPEETWGEDHPIFSVTRRILDRILVGHGMDPAEWKLHIINIPGNENISAIVDGHFVIFSGVFYSFEAEEAIATLMTNALSNHDCNYQAEIQSYRLLKSLSLASATNLFVTSFFAKKLWFVTIPYMAWWAWYKFSGEGRCQIMMQEIDHNSLVAMVKAGINPVWAPATWVAYAQGLTEASQMIENDESMKKQLGPLIIPLVENMRENAVGFLERAARMMELLETDPFLKKAAEAIDDIEDAEMTPLPAFVKEVPPGEEEQDAPSDQPESSEDGGDVYIEPDS